MSKILHYFIKGMVVILPIGLTLYFIYWLGFTIEISLKPLIEWGFGEDVYFPGIGLISGLLVVILIGITIEAWFIKSFFDLAEKIMERIPLVKSVYSGLRDFMKYFSSDQKDDLQKVVMVEHDGFSLMGFVTNETLDELHFSSEDKDIDDEIIAVYLPMSYQIGGYTVFLPKSKVRQIDMPIEDAMRYIFTAGLSSSDAKQSSIKVAEKAAQNTNASDDKEEAKQ